MILQIVLKIHDVSLILYQIRKNLGCARYSYQVFPVHGQLEKTQVFS